MNRALTTLSQDPKETPAMQAYRAQWERMGNQVRGVAMETRVQMEEEAPVVRRVHLGSQELQDSRAAQVLLVHRVAEGTTVNVDQKEPLAFLDPGVNPEQSETQEKPGTVALMDRRANQEIQVQRVLQDHRDPEDCRVKMVKTVMDLLDLQVSRGILVFLVTPVYWVRMVSGEPKGIQDAKGTTVEAGTQAGRENWVCLETRDIQDTGVPEVPLEAVTCLSASWSPTSETTVLVALVNHCARPTPHSWCSAWTCLRT